MMSIFSPRSSETTMRTREPRGPTHAPTGSTPCACDSTAIFERYPGSRATPRISTSPSAISGTSSSKSVLISSGSRRDRITCGPFAPLRTSVMTALMREPCSWRSPSTCSERGKSASTLPRSTSTLLRSPACWTMPVTTSLTRSTYSSYIISRSASRIRCRMTCLAVCAAMRPKFSGVTSSRFTRCSGTSDQSMSRSSSVTSVCERSPVSASSRSSSSSARSRASSRRRSSMSGGSSIEKTRNSPSPGSSSTVAWRDAPGVFLYAASSASSSAWMSVFSSIPFSRSIVLTASMISRLISLPLVDHVAPHDLGVRDEYRLAAVRAELHASPAGVEDLAPEPPPSVDLVLRAEGDAAADGVGEVGGLAERPLQARRGDVDRVAVEVAPQEIRHQLAERVVDPGRMVDVDAEPLRRHELDGQHLDPGQAGFDLLGHLALECLLGSPYVLQAHVLSQKKRAQSAHFAKPVKCGARRIASGKKTWKEAAPSFESSARTVWFWPR